MNRECRIIGDILPLYAEDMVSDETKEFVEAHIKDCAECREALEKIKRVPISPEISAAPLKDVKMKLRRKRMKSVLLAVLIVLALAVSAFSYLTAPQYISYDEAEYELTLEPVYGSGEYVLSTENGNNETEFPDVPEDAQGARLVFSFSEEATRCSLDCVKGEDGVTQYFVSAWYTVWDSWFDKNSEASCIADFGKDDEIAVWYEQNNGEEDVLIFSLNHEQNGGVITLPRLVEGYYLLIALGLAGLLGVLWLIFRKKDAGKVFKALFFLPVSYLCGSILTQGLNTVSYSATRDIVLTAIAGALIYLAVLVGLNLAKNKRDEA